MPPSAIRSERTKGMMASWLKRMGAFGMEVSATADVLARAGEAGTETVEVMGLDPLATAFDAGVTPPTRGRVTDKSRVCTIGVAMGTTDVAAGGRGGAGRGGMGRE
jgi:hypothetical protein